MSKYRHLLLFSCLALIPIGFALKFYSGPGNHWPNNYGAGVVYVIFFSLLAATIWPEEKYRFRIPLIVLLVTALASTFIGGNQADLYRRGTDRHHFCLVGFPALYSRGTLRLRMASLA